MPALLKIVNQFSLSVVLCAGLLSIAVPAPAAAQVTAFRQAVAESAARNEALAEFYRGRDFEGIWTGSTGRDRARRNAFLGVLADAGDHGLPMSTYDPDQVMARLRAAETPAEKGATEVYLSELFLQYARDVQTGLLRPGAVVPAIKREVPLRSQLSLIRGMAQSNPAGFVAALPPQSPEYARLLREKMRLERLLAEGGWGAPVPAGRLEPGDSGAPVVALRDRLVRMGYMERAATQAYDAAVQAGVQRFQQAHGLNPDGIVGGSTLRALNVSAQARLQSVMVAMERERWMNRPRGERHVWVNLADFHAILMDDDEPTFMTRSVIGARASDRQSPEFSDVMEFMVINPSWYVPRSIITKEYLPMLQSNPNAVSHIEITDSRGRRINRGAVDFSQFNRRNFPFSMRQPPSRGNALGLVKFMFPNQYNIYLHDTPEKSLFSRQTRTFSHGCIRLNEPFEFAYTLLAPQTSDPEGFFHSRLDTGQETRVDLEQPVPVHIVYRTAFTHTDGALNFREDVYGRDAQIWRALADEGVAVRAVGG
ncbi:L,D-transpeptidase family protein [Roseovarius sp. SYSU LYC5161]|jgi:murein L,D-transpeptidase YcbB/YkuD|uniref:L,D-transpeptidase family protein n=1 Tax=Roseovarius halophilus (ex Wu et al. 2025) TaxID=3376060 RepID=UPI00399A0B3F